MIICMQSISTRLSQETILVVTVCKDDFEGLSTTIESTLSQDFNNWRQVVVLSGPSDAASEAAVHYHNLDHRIEVINQTGTGIYNAMNSGLKGIASTFVWFMNAGDIFADVRSMSKAIEIINEFDADLLIGGYGILGNDKKYSFPTSKLQTHSFSLNRRGGCHQSMVFRNGSKTQILYDEKYRIAADFKLVLQFISTGKAFRVPDELARIAPDGISSKLLSQTLFEKQLIRKEFFGPMSAAVLNGKIWTCAVKFKVGLRGLLKSMNYKLSNPDSP